MIHKVAAIRVAMALVSGFSVCAGSTGDPLPEGPEKAVFVKTCSGCHGAQIVVGRGNNEDGWTQLVLSMISRGAQGSEDDFAQVVDYLSRNFPPIPAKVNVNKASVDELQGSLDLTPKEARAVAAYRQSNGEFRSLEDLCRVPSLDRKRIESHKDIITF